MSFVICDNCLCGVRGGGGGGGDPLNWPSFKSSVHS